MLKYRQEKGKSMKKLSVAFIWHMHQPNYKTPGDDVFLMPWTRLNAVKTYLKMISILEDFPKLKLNFDISPVLLDAIDGYANKGYNDIHSNLTQTSVEELTQDDMEFILNYFFSANYNYAISKYPRYADLYKRRFEKEEIDTDEFSLSDYADIMTLFNLVWFDDKYLEEYPEIGEIAKKGKHYSKKHCEAIIRVQREIIGKIIPTLKKYVSEKRAEILTCPYYHPILPLIYDMDSAKSSFFRNPVYETDIKMPETAKAQIQKGIERTKEIFGETPLGMWSPECCISMDILKMIADCGIKWTVSDERVLSSSLGQEFVRDFKGFHKDPFSLCQTYSVNGNNGNNLKLIFRDAVIPNLISFEYPNYDSKTAARDLYEQIKAIYDKFLKSPHRHHLLTIAMDGENAWRNYSDNGNGFLTELYSLITEDETLETVRVSDYINSVDYVQSIDSMTSGQWVNHDFRFWTGENVKNLAWRNLYNVYKDLKRYTETENIPEENVKAAYNELYTAEGSDWFWWFGEPNDSGQDHLFDYLFREHLKSVYMYLNKPIPEHLDNPLTTFSGKPSRIPKGFISPDINKKADYENDWKNAGCIEIPASPLVQENKLFNRIYFGCDSENLYLLFDINDFALNIKKNAEQIYQIYVYIRTHKDDVQNTAPVRPLNKNENVCSLLKNGYTHELKLTFMQDRQFPPCLSKAVKNNLWVINMNSSAECVYDDSIKVKIPFDDLDVSCGEKIDFFIINSTFGRTDHVYPKDVWLTIKRPENQ